MKETVMKETKQLVSSYIAKHLDVLDNLSDKLADILKIDRSQYMLWVSVKRNKLLIMTDDSLFASQLRFQENTIQQHVNRLLLTKLNSIKIKLIAPPPKYYEKKQQRCFHISAHNAKILSDIADEIDDDDIRQLLKRVAQSS